MARILIVDDDKETLESSVDVVRAVGRHDVESAANMQEALDKVRTAQKPFDLIITDYNMPPGGDGVQLAMTLRGDGVAVPIILRSLDSIGVIQGEMKKAGIRFDLETNGVTYVSKLLENTIASVRRFVPDALIQDRSARVNER